MIEDHFGRLKDSLANTYSLANLSKWIEEKTKYEGRKFTYLGREYQRDIIDDPTKTLYVVKCAQVGLSEIFARWALAAAVSQENFTVIYTFPAATDAELFSKSRLFPVIRDSAAIQGALSKSVDSVELKQFNANSFLYTRGTFSDTGALSVPADLIIHDEYDRSDMANVAAYVSRLQAKPTKMRRVFSTPTVAKYGIDAESRNTRRKKQVWTCSCCAHTFLPSYHDNVVIPGWDGDKKLITKANLKDVRYREAVLLCPKCGRVPSSELKYRQWVVENSMEAHDNYTYYVAPFCAPTVIDMPYLVKASTEFDKWSEFCNQALGECAESSDDTLTEADIRNSGVQIDLRSSALHHMGIDFGITCHIVIGRFHENKFLVVHREKVFYTQLEERRSKLCQEWRCLVSVHDLFPYTDMVTRITNFDLNAYGAVYVEKKSTEAYYLKEQEADPEEGKLNVRSVMINRNIAFDELMAVFKAGNVVVAGLDEEFVDHLRSMKRVQKFDRIGNMRYVWEKTDGTDHYHHATLYCWVAASLQGTATGFTAAGAVPLVSTFKRGAVEESLGFSSKSAA